MQKAAFFFLSMRSYPKTIHPLCMTYTQVVVEASKAGSRLIEAWQVPSSGGGNRKKLDLPTDHGSSDKNALGRTILVLGVAALVTGIIILAVSSLSSSSYSSNKKQK